jgi:hypothetical protein
MARPMHCAATMKSLCALLFMAAACGDPFTFDFDLGGPITGDQEAVTFSFVDGCTGGDVLFECGHQLPHFAVASEARFIIGSTTGDADDERRVGRARVRTQDETIAIAYRDEEGLLILDALAPGETRLEIVEDGDVLDSILIQIEPIVGMAAGSFPPPLYLAGSVFKAGVTAKGPTGLPLYGRMAITPKPLDGLEIDPEASAFFTSSLAVPVTKATPGDARMQFWADTFSAEATYRIVTREDITEVTFEEVAPTPGSNKATLTVWAKSGDQRVHGGPVCDWSIASGGGPNVSLSSRVGDDLANTFYVLYDSALIYGSGETTIRCAVNDRVVGYHTLYLGQ